MIAIGTQQSYGEVHEDVGPAPFAPVHAADETDANPLGTAALADAHCVATPVLPGLVRQGDALDVVSVVFLAKRHRFLDFVRVQVAAAPDHIAVTTSGDSLLGATATFLLTATCLAVDALAHGLEVTMPTQLLLPHRRV